MKTIIFVALLSAFSTLASAGSVPELSCFGTEPFWGLSTNASGALSISDPMSDTNKTYSKTTLKNAAGTADGFAFQIEARDSLDNVLKLNVVRSECNDGMSDNIYPYTAMVDVDGSILFGCCK